MGLTASDIITRVRSQVDEPAAAFWTDAEILKHLYDAECLLAQIVGIEKIYQTLSVAAQQAYAMPEYCMEIQRITYAGEKLKKIDQREFDALTDRDQTDDNAGDPMFYWPYERELTMFPTPSADGDAIKVYCKARPVVYAIATQPILIDQEYAPDLKAYVLWMMFDKDSDKRATAWKETWQDRLKEIRQHSRLKKRGDAMAVQKDEDFFPETEIGLY
ncbi:MAG TPA: hypothetical protein P5110_07570 [Candidatus Omnitrophota bacterium]|nr:hypothetical protein [Candidatus Omnitrophota bacterium]